MEFDQLVNHSFQLQASFSAISMGFADFDVDKLHALVEVVGESEQKFADAEK